jgi:hypothetical protein
MLFGASSYRLPAFSQMKRSASGRALIADSRKLS